MRFKVSKCISSPHYSRGKFVTNGRVGNKVNVQCISACFNLVSSNLNLPQKIRDHDSGVRMMWVLAPRRTHRMRTHHEANDVFKSLQTFCCNLDCIFKCLCFNIVPQYTKFLFNFVETLSCSNSHSSILPWLQTTTEPQTSRAGNHFTSEKIQTTPLGQGAIERQGKAAWRTQTGYRAEANQRIQIIHAKTAQDVRERACQRSKFVYGGEPREGSQ